MKRRIPPRFIFIDEEGPISNEHLERLAQMRENIYRHFGMPPGNTARGNTAAEIRERMRQVDEHRHQQHCANMTEIARRAEEARAAKEGHRVVEGTVLARSFAPISTDYGDRPDDVEKI